MPLEKSGFMKATDLKKLSSELVESSKVGVVIPASIDRGVHECSAFSTRMKMKLPLQQTNVMVDNLAVTGNEMSVWNDPNDPIVCDSVEGVLQSVTELCTVEGSDKKPAAEARANSVESRGKVLLKLAIVASMSVVLGLATMLKLKWLQSVKIDII